MDISGVTFTAKQAAARKYPLQFIADFAGAVLDGKTGELFEYRHLMKNDKYKEDWGHSFENEIGRLCQGMPGRNDGTNTMFFINKEEVPSDRRKDVTYGKINVNVRPQKEEVNRSRLTVGGDRINYEGDCSTPAAKPLDHQTALQQHRFNARREIFRIGSEGFLPQHPDGTPRVYEDDIIQLPGGRH